MLPRISQKTCFLLITLIIALPSVVFGASGAGQLNLHETSTTIGLLALAVFVVAYLVVMTEEFTHLAKSKPVVLGAGVIWLLVAAAAKSRGGAEAEELGHAVNNAIKHNVLEFGELFLFLLVAMTYINALAERRAFEALRAWLVRKGFSYKSLFWITGGIGFFLSPVADNLTSGLLMCAVVMAVGADRPKFVGIACINIVVAVNAGGAFSPFGDITTLMVWQAGKVEFATFFKLFVPSVVNYVLPAFIMSLYVPSGTPEARGETVEMRRGARRIMVLFLGTIATAVLFHNNFHLPPAVGMMTGLGYLKFFAFYLKKSHREGEPYDPAPPNPHGPTAHQPGFDVFRKVSMAEWDTLLFFYGVILCVGGLGALGYLSIASEYMYVQLGETWANSLVGVLSAIVDNIPVMFAVLTMDPSMNEGQWLLVTLTAGVGGSMLSVGSAAGVALMGQARGFYTFVGHLKWTPVIALGYVASILVHMWINM